MAAIYYFSNPTDANVPNIGVAIATSNTYTVGNVDSGSIGSITQWVIACPSTGTSIGIVINGVVLNSPGIYYLFPLEASPPPPYGQRECPAPPYNATNFTPANSVEFSTLQGYASNSPNYPWNTGSNAQQIYRSRQNITYFNNLNQQTQAIKTQNVLGGPSYQIPYPQFRTQAERLMYIQGQALTAARNQITGQNPSAPAGVPCSTIYGIIHS